MLKRTFPKTTLIFQGTTKIVVILHNSKEAGVYSKSAIRQLLCIYKENLGTFRCISHMVVADRYLHTARIAFQKAPRYIFRNLFVYRRNRLPY